jgi:four helix bundle protein
MKHTYSFEKMAVWQAARQAIKQIYLKTKNYPKEELFGITSQIRRAGISINCNLAEGSGRTTPKGQSYFYEIAYGSALEVINLLILSNDLEFLSDEDYESLRTEMEKITWQINKLMPLDRVHDKPL